MNIQSVKNYVTAPHTENTVPEKKDKNIVPENTEDKNKVYLDKQFAGTVVGAALSAAVLGGAVMHGN